ncbi:MAG: carotenoid biosynthesis protein [Cytophagales bacterium]|nr:MAG: carotenoid biosynthesis protein [Cytophagales bacterium]
MKNDIFSVKILLIAMYVAGAIGLKISLTRDLFLYLVPLNLLFSAWVLVYFQPQRNRYFWTATALVYALGYGVEVAGVATGVIFGEYWYSTVLGIQVLQVPLLIGVNWWLLGYCAAIVSEKYMQYDWQKILSTATLMTLLDVCIEPIAIALHFWYWKNNLVPFQNYLAWFLVSIIVAMVLHYHKGFEKKNTIAPLLLALQFSFFAILNLLFYLFP